MRLFHIYFPDLKEETIITLLEEKNLKMKLVLLIAVNCSVE